MQVKTIEFEHNSLDRRLRSMLRVDLRRMFTTPLIYIMLGICFVMPILILVMTTMMANTPDAELGASFTNVWQIIGTVSDGGMAKNAATPGMSMDLVSMCNINMLYFAMAVLVCIFVADDFRSGYSKNLFTARAKKNDYVISKTIVGIIGGVCMLISFFVGAMIGGAIANLSFDVGVAGIGGIVMCLISKLLLVAVFVPIFLAVSVAAKQRLWLSIIGSLGVSMLLFTMIPMMTPLNSGILNVVMCLGGGALFSVGLGAVSNLVLEKTSLV